jgi:hypothetical protein
VTVGGALILYATAVGLTGAVGFRRAHWPLRTAAGAAAVLAAAWSVPVALVLAGMTIILRRAPCSPTSDGWSAPA